MNKCNKFEYFLNAIYYNLAIIDVQNDYSVRLFGLKIISILKYMIINKDQSKYHKYLSYEQNRLKNDLHDKLKNDNIGSVDNWFIFSYSGYTSVFSFILLQIADRKIVELNSLYTLLLIAIPWGICYIPAYRAVYTNNRYLKYFRKFKKKIKIGTKGGNG